MNEKRLLVVDDQIEIGEIVRQIAEPLGYAVTVRCDTGDIMECVRAIDPDTVILDIIMPIRDGIEIVRELAKAKSGARLLLMSGSSDFYLASAERLAIDYGLRNVRTMRKPLRVAALRSFLRGEAFEPDPAAER